MVTGSYLRYNLGNIRAIWGNIYNILGRIGQLWVIFYVFKEELGEYWGLNC